MLVGEDARGVHVDRGRDAYRIGLGETIGACRSGAGSLVASRHRQL